MSILDEIGVATYEDVQAARRLMEAVGTARLRAEEQS